MNYSILASKLRYPYHGFFRFCFFLFTCVLSCLPAARVIAQVPQAVSISVDSTSLTHILWNNPDQSVSLWSTTVDSQGNGSDGAQYAYGPFAGWSAIQTATGGITAKTPRILWSHAPDGEATLYSIDSYGNPTNVVYGPVSGWISQSLNAGPTGAQGILWNHAPDNQTSLYSLDRSGNFLSYQPYGPFPGYTATFAAVGGDGFATLLWNKSDGSISLWKFLSAANTNYTYHLYGPYAGWSAKSVAVGGDNIAHVLWTKQDGTIAVWSIGLSSINGQQTYNSTATTTPSR